MIDLHTHLLPGVDDGSPSIERSLPVLERFGAEGVEIVVCTPHLQASAAATAPRERYAAILADLATAATAIPRAPRLELGWEVMLDEPGAALAGFGVAMGASTAILVEFPRTNVPSGGAAELFRLRMSGVVPVLAHPERYWGCTVDMVREWRHVGAVIQLDAVMLLNPSPAGQLARALITGGLVDCIASDNHADSRTMTVARKWLDEQGGEEQGLLLTQQNPSRLLTDRELLPVPPLRRERGMFARLRELVGGNRASRR